MGQQIGIENVLLSGYTCTLQNYYKFSSLGIFIGAVTHEFLKKLSTSQIYSKQSTAFVSTFTSNFYRPGWNLKGQNMNASLPYLFLFFRELPESGHCQFPCIHFINIRMIRHYLCQILTYVQLHTRNFPEKGNYWMMIRVGRNYEGNSLDIWIDDSRKNYDWIIGILLCFSNEEPCSNRVHLMNLKWTCTTAKTIKLHFV